MVDDYRGSMPRLGSVKNVQHEISVTDESKIYSKPYSIPVQLLDEVKEEIQELKNQEILRISQSKYLSPAFVVRKANGSIRLLIDYRKLNERTVKEEFPFNGIDALLQGLYGYEVFSTIDLAQGYYQMEVEEQSRKYIAIILPFGCYEFTRMPFGLVNRPRASRGQSPNALEI